MVTIDRTFFTGLLAGVKQKVSAVVPYIKFLNKSNYGDQAQVFRPLRPFVGHIEFGTEIQMASLALGTEFCEILVTIYDVDNENKIQFRSGKLAPKSATNETMNYNFVYEGLFNGFELVVLPYGAEDLSTVRVTSQISFTGYELYIK